MKAYKKIAGYITAMENNIKSKNDKWYSIHRNAVETIMNNHSPRGSGFDSGTEIDFDASKPNKLVFYTHFHHMNENGYYDGWTDHSIIVIPDLVCDFDISVSGSNKNEINDYIAEIFEFFLNKEIE